MAGPFHSPLAVFSGSPPTADEKGRAADTLRQAAEIAGQHKVMLTMEYLNRFECYFLTTAADAKALVQAVKLHGDRDNPRALWHSARTAVAKRG